MTDSNILSTFHAALAQAAAASSGNTSSAPAVPGLASTDAMSTPRPSSVVTVHNVWQRHGGGAGVVETPYIDRPPWVFRNKEYQYTLAEPHYFRGRCGTGEITSRNPWGWRDDEMPVPRKTRPFSLSGRRWCDYADTDVWSLANAQNPNPRELPHNFYEGLLDSDATDHLGDDEEFDYAPNKRPAGASTTFTELSGGGSTANKRPRLDDSKVIQVNPNVKSPDCLTLENFIRRDDVLQWFRQLAAYRRNSNDNGNEFRNSSDCLSRPLLGMLDEFAERAANNPGLAVPVLWRDMSDTDLQSTMERWMQIIRSINLDSRTEPVGDPLEKAIKSLYAHRIRDEWGTDNRFLQEMLVTMMDTLKPWQLSWEACSHADQTKWALLLIRILLDPKVTKDPNQHPLSFEDKAKERERSDYPATVPEWFYRFTRAIIAGGERPSFVTESLVGFLLLPEGHVGPLPPSSNILLKDHTKGISIADVGAILREACYNYFVVMRRIACYGTTAHVGSRAPPRVAATETKRASNSAHLAATSNKKPAAKAVVPATNASQGIECYRCGRTQHSGAACPYHEHPGCNTDPNVRWVDSASAAEYRATSTKKNTPPRVVLPLNSTANGEPYSGKGSYLAVHPDKKSANSNVASNKPIFKKKGTNYITSIINNTYPFASLTPISLFGMTFDVPNTSPAAAFDQSPRTYRKDKQFRALIDTGASVGNYISRSVATWLERHGHEKRTPTVSSIGGASAQSTYSIVGSFTGVTANLITDSGQPLQLSLDFEVIDSASFDIIIGLPTIRQYDITQALRSIFKKSTQQSTTTTTTSHPRVCVFEDFAMRRSKTEHSVARQLQALTGCCMFLAALSQQELSNNRYAVARSLAVEYTKEELLGIPEEDDFEEPEWHEDLMDLLPGAVEPEIQSDIPLIKGNLPFQNKLRNVLLKYKDVFRRKLGPVPATVDPHPLNLVANDDWFTSENQGPPRRQSLAKSTALRNHVDTMLANGIIKRSQAAHYSQAVLVKKPHQPDVFRFCVDYRNLNKNLKSMGWPIPNIELLFQRLGAKKAKYFAVLDFTSGYHQVMMDEATRHLAAFITEFGVFEPVRLWMGIKSAPSYFQQKIAEILQGLLYEVCELYIDDIIIFGETEEEFVAHLEKVLKRLKEFNIFLNPDKAKIGETQLEYVGHIINKDGHQMSDEKIRKVVEFPQPVTVKGLKQFLGLVNYFRQHVRNFSSKSHTLSQATLNYDKNKYKKLVWTADMINEFESIKEDIRKNPLLHFINPSLPIALATDASDYGIGAYLYQIVTTPEEDGNSEIHLPVAFLSASLDKVQVRWSTIEKECYAIWYALKKWEHHLRDVHFTIYTDHNNLRYLNNNSAKVVRWKLAVQEYDFVLRHLAGSLNVVADAFSRLCSNVLDLMDAAGENTDEEDVASPLRYDSSPVALCTLYDACPCLFADSTICAVTRLNSGTIQPQSHAPPTRRQKRSFTAISDEDTSEPAVSNPAAIETPITNSIPAVVDASSDVVTTVESVEQPTSSTMPITKRQRRRMRTAISRSTTVVVPDGASSQAALQDVQIPDDKRRLIEGVHGLQAGHMGCKVTLERLRSDPTFEPWPYMALHVQKFIRECTICQKLRAHNMVSKAPPFTLPARTPWERICIDTIGPLTKTDEGYEHILVVIDSFSRFVEMYPLKSTKAEEAVVRLTEHAGRYGTPLQLLSDGGTQFLNDCVQLLNKTMNISYIQSTPHSKEENGLVERANKEVLRHIRAFVFDDKLLASWSRYIPMVQRIMNGQPHSVLKVSPAEIIFGTSTYVDYRLFNEIPTDQSDHNDHFSIQKIMERKPTLRTWLNNHLDAQRRIINIAIQNQLEHDAKHYENFYAENPQPYTIFAVGTYVLCTYPDQGMGKKGPSKLNMPMRGPFQVLDYDITKRQYHLLNVQANRSFTIDPSKVFPYYYDSTRTNPTDVAMHDKQATFVKEVLAVRGNSKKLKSLEFKVCWEGEGVASEWVPYSVIRDSEACHTFLRSSDNSNLRAIAINRERYLRRANPTLTI